jgi:MFS family permease
MRPSKSDGANATTPPSRPRPPMGPPAVPGDPPSRQALPPPWRRWLAGITRVVIVLSVISLFTDIASEMVAPLRLLFLVQVLGAPLTLAGLVEGVAEGVTGVLRIVAGRLADRVTARHGLVLWGYALSNAAKPLLVLAMNWPVALGLILIDRGGKALRGSPRDAMVADATAPAVRGKAFGFHRGADTLGAAIGPLLALAVLSITRGNLRTVFAWTLVPGALAVLVAAVFLRRPRAESLAGRRAEVRDSSRTGEAPTIAVSSHSQAPGAAGGTSRPMGATRALGAPFWLFTAVATCFALGNSSDAFLFLRTEGLEASLLAVPLLYCGFNVTYALLAAPMGALSDRWGRLPVLAMGYAAFTLVYLGWTQARAGWQVWGLFLLYGLYYAATEGVARAFVADLVPAVRRGTALGWFNGLTGIAALPANLVGAWLWSWLGPGATFGLGAWLATVALGLLLAWWPRLRPASVAGTPVSQQL